MNRGDVLFVVDPRPYQAVLDQAKAALASAKARASFAKTDFERAQSLTRTGNITEQAPTSAARRPRPLRPTSPAPRRASSRRA